MSDYSWVTDEMFDEKLREICETTDLLSIPGVYEVVREELNNEVLDALAQDRENDEYTTDTLTIGDETF